MVYDWHKAMGRPDLNRDTIGYPSDSNCKLRVALIKEELLELEQAIVNKDLIEVADAIGDILFVAFGAACAFGIDIEPVFREIYKSNMTKVPMTGEEPKYDANGKLLKPEHFSPPDLSFVLE